MQFKNVAKAHIGPETVARFDIPEIEGCPWLEVRPAGESNKAYFNEALRQQAKDARRVSRGVMSVEDTVRERAQAIEPYAKHILTGNGGGWISAETDAEVAMPLDLDSRIVLLKSLPPDVFDRLRIFCNQLQNFRD